MNPNVSVPPNRGIVGRNRGLVVEKPKDMRGTLSKLWNITKGHRKGLWWIVLFSALASFAGIFSPYITGKAVTAVQGGDDITSPLIMLGILYVGDALTRFFQQYILAGVGQDIIDHIRKTLFDKIKELPLRFFDNHRHGELMSRLTNDIDNINTTISDSLSMLLTHAFTIVGILVMMLSMNVLLTLISFVGVGLIIILTKVVTDHTKVLFRKQQQSLGILNGTIEENVSGLELIKLYGREGAALSDFNEKNEDLRKVSTKALIWSGYMMPLTNVINNLCYLSVAVLSSIMFVNGKISDIGLITSFLLYVRRFTRPFVEISNIYNNFQTAVAGAERVFEIMEEEEEPRDKPDAAMLTDPRGDIVLKDLRFGYTEEKEILKGIDLSVKAGTKVAIVGPTGSGKTTIINLLTRFYDVTGGSISLDGHDLRDYRMEDLRKAYGVVLQDTSLFADTVMNNISYGNEEKSFEEIKRAARMTGADEFISKLPNGYDTYLEQAGEELSQGERQLITISRAILTDAPIMILDEATSSVDTVTEQKIRRAILEICEGRTSFIIAHRLSTIRDSDLIILIEDGQIAEQGTHEELMKLSGKYAKMYLTQTQ